MEHYLAVVAAALLGLAVVLYVLLDGFGLGIGILFPSTRIEAERDEMMNTIAPFWDGNQTWLVLGGGGLLVAFPLAYSIVMPALHIPILVMLLGLVLRGVAFEFRWVAKPHHHWWDRAFFWGSITATFAQGCILGGIVQGIKVQNNEFAGGIFDWLTPFSLFCGTGLVAGYALLGACWLNFKTVGILQNRGRRYAKGTLFLVLMFMAGVSLWTPYEFPRIAERWFAARNIVFLWPVPVATAGIALFAYEALRRRYELAPFLGSIGIFLFGFLGLGISLYPYVIPPSVTLYDAAAPPPSLIFGLMGVLFVLPLVLVYTAFVYWTFHGKVLPGEGYH
jgi:cytochrome bd ubiquinol oxidase subunit II